MIITVCRCGFWCNLSTFLPFSKNCNIYLCSKNDNEHARKLVNVIGCNDLKNINNFLALHVSPCQVCIQSSLLVFKSAVFDLKHLNKTKLGPNLSKKGFTVNRRTCLLVQFELHGIDCNYQNMFCFDGFRNSLCFIGLLVLMCC